MKDDLLNRERYDGVLLYHPQVRHNFVGIINQPRSTHTSSLGRPFILHNISYADTDLAFIHLDVDSTHDDIVLPWRPPLIRRVALVTHAV